MPRPSRFLVTVSVADIHKDPAHESELVTQAILGQELSLLETADEERWYRVILPDGYQGWVRSWLVTAASAGWPGKTPVEIDVPLTWIRSKPDADSDPVCDVVIGTRLPREGVARRGWIPVRLPDGRRGFVSRTDLLAGTTRRDGGRPGKVEDFLATSRRFLGVPYVWGGRSPKGLDCSGFTQMVLALHGFGIPRDSRDQRTFCEERGPVFRDPLEVPRGGLLFFGRNPERASHVGFSLGGGEFIHAQAWVRVQSLDKSKPHFHSQLRDLFQVGSEVVTRLSRR